MRNNRVGILCVVLAPWLCQAQAPGRSPAPNIGPSDIYATYRLPALKDSTGAALDIVRLSLQVAARARGLQLNAASTTAATQNAANLLATQAALPVAPPHEKSIAVSSLADLNQALANPAVSLIRVSAASLWLDKPIDVNRGNVTLDLAGVALSGPQTSPWMLRVRHASDVAVRGGIFNSGDSAVLIQDSSRVTVAGAVMHALGGAGIVVTGSTHVALVGNRFTALQLAPIILHRGVTQSVVSSNILEDNSGSTNLAAGIVVTDREVDLSGGPRALFSSNGYWPVAQAITIRTNPPRDNVVASNIVTGNRSSGIYSDGGVQNVFYGNLIRGNAKEGLCLDNGSTANVVTGNTISQNGQRWGEPDQVLALEFIAGGGRLEDGTPAAKVPGISIDNAIYNVIAGNHLEHNFGGGIKIVRTGYFNVIGMNTLLNNNDGEGPAYHFFGIELGAAPGDASSLELDFTPSRGNIVFSNLIRGSHYSGIFIAGGSDLNDIFDNTIMEATHWALESAAQMPNSSLNNLTTVPSLNIASGLDPSSLK